MRHENRATIIGLVDAGGSGGIREGNSDQWRLAFRLAAWRHPGSPVEVGQRRCEVPVSESRLGRMMGRVGPYTIVRAKVAEDSTAEVLRLRRFVRIGTEDPDLEKVAAGLKEPVLFDDPVLGRFEYHRRSGHYAGQASWCGQPIKLCLYCDPPEQRAIPLATASRLFAGQEDWQARIRSRAAEKLLPLKNRSWLGDGEHALSPAEFLAKLEPSCLIVYEDGEFCFCHRDGDMFGGHGIDVTGSFSEGVVDANISG